MKLIVTLGLLLLVANQSHQYGLPAASEYDQDEVEDQEQYESYEDEILKVRDDLELETDPGILNTHSNLTTWAMREETIYLLAKERRKVLGRELRVLDKFIEDYEDSSLKVVKDLTLLTPDLDGIKDRAKLVGMNGIASYRMTFRYLEYLEWLRRIYKQNGENHLKTYLDQLKGEWPRAVDLKSQMIGFIHIQEVYDFPLDQISSRLSPDSKPLDLPALQCYQIGLLALQNDRFYQSIEWLEFAKRKVLEEGDESCSPVLIENALDSAIRTHNKALKTLSPNFINLYDKPVVIQENHKQEQDPPTTLSRVKRRNIQLELFKGSPTGSNKFNFWALCSGHDNLQKDEIKARLFCFYDREKSPYWYIGPMKVEYLSLNPPVMLVHEILTGSDIFEILKERDDWFERSVTGGMSDVYDPWFRTSVQFWLPEYPNVYIPQLNTKIEHMTGLKTQGEDSEEIQVLEYVFGRFYGPHRDNVEVPDPNSEDPKYYLLQDKVGDRVASVLFYLNTVEQGGGGSTPFVNLGFSVPPVKGNAIFWYNVWKNGTAREDTYHGSCPLLYGVKRVANKWIRYNPQFQSYQCSTNQWE